MRSPPAAANTNAAHANAPDGADTRDISPDVIADLKRQIRAMERKGAIAGMKAGGGGRVGLSPALDGLLPAGGLARGSLHEITGTAGANGAAAGFAAALLGLLGRAESGGEADQAGAVQAGPALWCRRHWDAHENGELYAPGLAAFGLDEERLLLVRAKRDADVLWAMEEGLRSPALAAVLGEVDGLDFTASRRLQLAAESSGVTCLVLRGAERGLPASAAATRWLVEPGQAEPGQAMNGEGARWRLRLLRVRGGETEGEPRTWPVEWRDGRLCDGTEGGGSNQDGARRRAVAADLRDRPGEPRPSGLAL